MVSFNRLVPLSYLIYKRMSNSASKVGLSLHSDSGAQTHSVVVLTTTDFDAQDNTKTETLLNTTQATALKPNMVTECKPLTDRQGHLTSATTSALCGLRDHQHGWRQFCWWATGWQSGGRLSHPHSSSLNNQRRKQKPRECHIEDTLFFAVKGTVRQSPLKGNCI